MHPDELPAAGGLPALDPASYLKQLLLPPGARLCEPIPGVDALRLAAALGVDTRRLAAAAAAAARAASAAGAAAADAAAAAAADGGADPYAGAASVTLPCGACGGRYPLGPPTVDVAAAVGAAAAEPAAAAPSVAAVAAYAGAGRPPPAVVSGARCPTCAALPSAAVAVNAATAAMRGWITAYYTSGFVRGEAAAGARPARGIGLGWGGVGPRGRDGRAVALHAAAGGKVGG